METKTKSEDAKLNIVMISRATLFSSPGGDTIQIEKTAEYLRKLGVIVDIKLAYEEIDYSKYDLMHFFNIIRPNDFLHHVKDSNLPFVVSTIFVDYSEYEKKARTGIIKYLSKVVSSDQLEYLKVIARVMKNNEKLNSMSYLWKGQKRSIRFLIKESSMLLPNSNSEYTRLEKHFNISQTYHVIPNAIDTKIFKSSKLMNAKFENSIICIGRIEGRKNQLNLIKAINKTEYKLFIIGKKSPNQLAYYEDCLEEAENNSNVMFIDHIEQSELSSIMQAAKVHVLPSWFETTGLVSLEAAYLDCNLVITDKGDQKEYFEDMAIYCDPNNIESIIDAIDIAYNKPFESKLKEKILREYTWENTAKKTLDGYEQVLEINK